MDRLDNPYLEEYEYIIKGSEHLESEFNFASSILQWERRGELVSKYSFAIPNEEAIYYLVQHSPLIELGAGTGYWGYLIQQLGGDIICIDKAPDSSNDYVKGNWIDIQCGDENKILEYPNRTLFLCWPPYLSSFAYKALTLYKGNTFIYIYW